jgi:hypothetical protein
MYQALVTVGGASGRQNVADLAGRRGLAIVVTDHGITDELVVDPADGSFLGERQYDASTGTVIVYSAMAYGVVGALGDLPK